MKVHLISEATIDDFVRRHAASRPAFENWVSALKGADWNIPNDINTTFGSADLIGQNRVVFDIGGNNWRMICKYKFAGMIHLSVCFIGTHAEYDRLCANNEQYTVRLY